MLRCTGDLFAGYPASHKNGYNSSGLAALTKFNNRKRVFFNTWAPWTREDIDKLEGVQKRAVKAVSGLKGQSYEEKLAELKLPSLQNRRREIDMAQT